MVVVVLLGFAVTFFRLVAIRLWRIVPDDTLEEFELLLHRVVDARLNGGHGLERALKDSQRRAHRSLTRHVADLKISSRCEATAFLYDGTQKRVKYLARFLVWQRHDVIAHRTRRHIDVTPLARANRGVVTLDPQTLSLETTRKITESASINKLTDKAGTRLSKSADEMNKTESVEPKTRNVRVVHEVVALLFALIFWVPVASDRQDGLRSLIEGHHIGNRDFTFGFLFGVLVVREHEIDVHLQQLVPVIGLSPEPHLLRDGLLDLIEGIRRLRHVDITVEPRDLQLVKLVRGLAHDMGDAPSDFQAGRAIGYNHILSGEVHRSLTAQCWVVVYLLEGVTRQAETPQHPLMLRPILDHHIGKLVIHVVLNPGRSVTLLRGLLTDDLRPHWPLGRERLGHGLGLELDQRFGE